MKNKKLFFPKILLCILLTFNLHAQDDPIIAEITMPTYVNGCDDGGIDIQINGGYPPYDVVWYRVILGIPQNYEQVIQENFGILGDDDGEDIENIDNDRYKVVVTDALCGTVTKSFTLICECTDDCNLDATITNAECDQNGAIETTINCSLEGHVPFTYRWLDLGSWENNSPNRYNLSPGTYCLVVKDQANCEYEDCWIVGNEGVNFEVKLKEKKNIPFCKEEEAQWPCTGSLEIEVPLGTTIAWQNVPNTNQASSNIVSDLCVGVYTVIVSLGDCSITKNFNITCCSTLGDGDESSIDPISISGEVTSATNTMSMDGRIILTVYGGAPPLIFEWIGPNNYSSTSQNITGLSPGNYCVTVFDGCSKEQKCFEIVDCSLFTISVEAEILETCDDVSAGSILLIINGGTEPYEVAWSNNASGNLINGLDAGEYCATIKDVNGCSVGPFCYAVGTKSGMISTSTVPCARTIQCNGQNFTEYFEYDQSLNCNTLSSFCPITGQTVVVDLGWDDIEIDNNCNMIGICRDGSQRLLHNGQRETGPFGTTDNSCSENIGCASSACYFPELLKYYKDPLASTSCAIITYQEHASCPGECLIQAICGQTVVASGCGTITGGCNSFNDPGNDHLRPDLSTVLNFNEIIRDKEDFLNNINNRQVEDVSGIGESIRESFFEKNNVNKLLIKSKFYPNPFSDEINMEVHLSKALFGTITITSLYGEEVFVKKTQLEKGINVEKINMSDFPVGVYFVRLVEDGQMIRVQKVIKY